MASGADVVYFQHHLGQNFMLDAVEIVVNVRVTQILQHDSGTHGLVKVRGSPSIDVAGSLYADTLKVVGVRRPLKPRRTATLRAINSELGSTLLAGRRRIE